MAAWSAGWEAALEGQPEAVQRQTRTLHMSTADGRMFPEVNPELDCSAHPMPEHIRGELVAVPLQFPFGAPAAAPEPRDGALVAAAAAGLAIAADAAADGAAERAGEGVASSDSSDEGGDGVDDAPSTVEGMRAGSVREPAARLAARRAQSSSITMEMRLQTKRPSSDSPGGSRGHSGKKSRTPSPPAPALHATGPRRAMAAAPAVAAAVRGGHGSSPVASAVSGRSQRRRRGSP
jgi:hypothetical protein